MNADGMEEKHPRDPYSAHLPILDRKRYVLSFDRSAAAQYFPGGALYFSFFSRLAYIETKEHQQSIPE
jgi:hypothetical protein